MKELLRKCPHHQISRWQILQGFHDGLTEAHRLVIDSSYGGSLMMKSEDDAWVLYDTLSENALHNTRPTVLRHQAGRKGVLEVGPCTQVQSQLDSLSRKMDQLLTRGAGYSQPVCGLCDSIGHVTYDCPISLGVDASTRQVVNAAQDFSRPAYDPYSSTYNPGWRNHPNFGWRNTGYQSQNQTAVPPQRQIEYPQTSRYQSGPSSSTLEDRLMKVYEDIKASNEKTHVRFDQIIGSHSQTLAKRVDGSLPSQPLGNPKGKGPVYVVGDAGRMDYEVSALRSGREYQPPHQEQQPTATQTRSAASTPDPFASSRSS
ncbi:unnamed protein product [Victoria cruziana]